MVIPGQTKGQVGRAIRWKKGAYLYPTQGEDHAMILSTRKGLATPTKKPKATRP